MAQSIIDQFVEYDGIEALDACLTRNAASSEDEENENYHKIFNLAMKLRNVSQTYMDQNEHLLEHGNQVFKVKEL